MPIINLPLRYEAFKPIMIRQGEILDGTRLHYTNMGTEWQIIRVKQLPTGKNMMGYDQIHVKT